MLSENGLPFFAWTAYIPFFLLAERISIKASFLYGFSFGFIFYSLLCWWFSSFGLIALSFVSFLYSFYYSIVLFLIVFAKKVLPQKIASLYWLLRVFILISFDYLRTFGPLGFSYGVIAYTQWRQAAFLSFASFFGVQGVSFLIYVFSSLIADVISTKNIRRNLKKISLCVSLVLAVMVSSKFNFSKESESSSLKIALIQDASSAKSENISDYVKDVSLLKKLTDQALALKNDTELIIWPETAVVPDILHNFSDESEPVRHLLALDLISYIKSKNASFVIGNNFSSGKKSYNAALYFNTDGEVEIYKKNHLVPFTEYWPSFLKGSLFEKIKDTLDSDLFTPGEELAVFRVKDLTFSVPICFEDSFSGLVRKMKKSGADFFVNISDDAWAHSAAARNIHCAMSAFRSAEYRTVSLRSTVDGKTCIIGADGLIKQELESGIDGFLNAEVSIEKNSRTLYSCIGDLPSLILTVVTLFLLLILSLRFVRVR